MCRFTPRIPRWTSTATARCPGWPASCIWTIWSCWNPPAPARGICRLAGDLAEPVDLRQLAGMLAAHIDLSTATVSGPCPESIRRVAYCTGSGSSLLEEARAAGADSFITGDVKYHTALDTQLCLFDVGHHSLEEEMMRRAAIHLQHACPMLEVVFVPSASPFQPVHPRVL